MSRTLEQFLEELKTQDRFCTASPIIIDLQQLEYIITDECHAVNSSKAKDCPFLTEAPEDLGLDPEETLYWKELWVSTGRFFFTHSGYEEHLRLNRHNYPKKIRPFIHHAFRNPEIEQVLGWLKELKTLREAK